MQLALTIVLSRDDVTFWIAIVGALTGIAGTLLGFASLWRDHRRDQVRLKVVPAIYFRAEDPLDQDALCIEVRNQGFIEVTVREVGFTFRSRSERAVMLSPMIIDGGSFPRRLAPNSGFTAYMPHDADNYEFFHDIKTAYATTDTGLTFTGNSPALQSIVKKYRSRRTG